MLTTTTPTPRICGTRIMTQPSAPAEKVSWLTKISRPRAHCRLRSPADALGSGRATNWTGGRAEAAGREAARVGSPLSRSVGRRLPHRRRVRPPGGRARDGLLPQLRAALRAAPRGSRGPADDRQDPAKSPRRGDRRRRPPGPRDRVVSAPPRPRAARRRGRRHRHLGGRRLAPAERPPEPADDRLRDRAGADARAILAAPQG